MWNCSPDYSWLFWKSKSNNQANTMHPMSKWLSNNAKLSLKTCVISICYPTCIQLTDTSFEIKRPCHQTEGINFSSNFPLESSQSKPNLLQKCSRQPWSWQLLLWPCWPLWRTAVLMTQQCPRNVVDRAPAAEPTGIAALAWNATVADAINAWEIMDVPVQRSATPTVALVEIIEHRIKVDEKTTTSRWCIWTNKML